MGHSVIQMWAWTLLISLSWMCVHQAVAKPQYMVAIPAVLEAGAETKFCASLLQPNETLVMTVTLMSQEKNTTLLQKTSNTAFHTCVQFQAPLEQTWLYFEVEVRGDTFYSKEVRFLGSKVDQPMTFIQTDKPIYLPGQTVHFRVVTLDTKFRPVNQLYNVITIQDANHNSIKQWLKKTSNGKILQLSYILNSEAHRGAYRIIVSNGRERIQHDFRVHEYVFLKFHVKINASDEISIGQEEFNAEVCAKYTYGQPVSGSVEVKVCQPLKQHRIQDDHLDAPCYKETKQADKRGCTTFSFKMCIFTKLSEMLQQKLDLTAKVEEEGTGISFSQRKNIRLSNVVGKLSFIDTPKIYDRGSNVEGKVKAVYYNNTPIPDMPVYLLEGETFSSRLLQNLTTDSNGVATFSFSTANRDGDILLHVSSTQSLRVHEHKTFYQTGEHTLSLAQLSSPDTETVSSLEVKTKDKPLPCDREENISIKYTVVGEDQGSVDVIYLVLARGAIVMQGFKQVEVQAKPVTKGKVSFMLKVSPEMASDVQVVAYAVLPSEIVIAHSADFSTEKCFSHKVSLEFSLSSAVPGEEITLKVTAQPDSMCGLSAIDQSVLVKQPEKTLEDKIFDLLTVEKAFKSFEFGMYPECLHARPRRSTHDYRLDAHTVFWSVGLKMATNLVIKMPPCLMFRGQKYYISHHDVRHGFSSFMSTPSRRLETGETVRTLFTETWIWDLVEVGESATKDVTLTVPDTITTWEMEAFCLSPQGFGLTHKEITTFKPFILELSLPYSIILGEHFELKATTFNYLSSCIMVTVTAAPSLDYTLTPLSGDQYTSCLCGSERKTVSWSMAPSAIGVANVSVTAEAVASQASCGNEIVSVPDRGRIDVVTRSFIVEAEGTEMTKTYNWLLCPKGKALTEEVELQLPENVIDGSARASLSVLGDILGRALKNLDGMLQMPYGCCEQNMVLLVPNIYILQYLKNTHQLTPAIKEKATNFLITGYLRQLEYRNDYGAYNTFGFSVGNTWLTAFVLRSFAKARLFIYIDPTKIEESKAWLESKQRKNGCFEQSGKLLNNRIKGGVSDEVTLSAYVTAAFLEMNHSVNDPVVNKSLSCLKESIGDLSNTYTTALLAYVFTLAGDMETRAHLLKHLDTVALNQGGFLHWSQTATETPASLSVEISSYVLLAKLSASPTAEDLGYATRIVRWLTGQQNHYGGFSSTQDTVVALQALALYSTLVFSPEGSNTVTVQSPSGQLTFNVNENNRLLYQEKLLQDVTGKYSLEVKGTACASMQISLQYNIPTPTYATILNVKVEAEANCTITSHRPKLTLNIRSLYSGKQTTTNMMILDIKMLSGFVPDPESFQSVEGAMRVDHGEDHVVMYIQELMKDTPTNHSLVLIQELPVQNLKPAVVKIYDYYQPSEQAETTYSHPCAAA